ncbi:MAG: ferritin-like domain-containing protein [Bdellovibrionales bacterium]|nr:ferritin-like domain-containing protein [Bdellovibrionales bacterium]
MALFHKEFNSLQELLVDQVRDLYDAEQRLLKALPKMAEAASSPELRACFSNHLQETKMHADRLEQVVQQLGEDAEAETCEAMKGLISEGEEMVKAKGDPDVRDAALIAAAQRVEHYEMAGYGAARSFAQRLGLTTVAEILQTTLEEEGNADKKLTQIALGSVNPQASRASTTM